VFPITNIDRMVLMLRLLTHGDDDLAHSPFSESQNSLVSAILQNDKLKASPCPLAPHSGFAKLSSRSACLIFDTKQNFAMEISDGKRFLVKNFVALNKPAQKASLQQSSEGSLLHMTHADGYERRCFLSADGTDLRVEDIHPGTIEIVFKIDSTIKLSGLQGGKGLMLITPERSAWILSCRGGDVHTEQNGSIIKINNSGQRCVNWALKKQMKTPRNLMRKDVSAPDLLD
jgi:uncharacterized heparinase superfamily protein